MLFSYVSIFPVLIFNINFILQSFWFLLPEKNQYFDNGLQGMKLKKYSMPLNLRYIHHSLSIIRVRTWADSIHEIYKSVIILYEYWSINTTRVVSLWTCFENYWKSIIKRTQPGSQVKQTDHLILLLFLDYIDHESKNSCLRRLWR